MLILGLCRFNEDDIGTAKFQYRNRDLTDLLKAGRVCRRRLALMFCRFIATDAYTGSFCEFLGQPQWTISH